jgi:hypothetical protein
VDGDLEELPASTRFSLTLQDCSGRHTLRLRHTDGVDWLPADEPLTRGATSRNLRVVGALWQNSSWRLRAEGLPGRDYPTDFFTDRSVVSATTERRIEKRKGGFRVVFTAPPNVATNAAGFVRWDAEVRFQQQPSLDGFPER